MDLPLRLHLALILVHRPYLQMQAQWSMQLQHEFCGMLLLRPWQWPAYFPLSSILSHYITQIFSVIWDVPLSLSAVSLLCCLNQVLFIYDSTSYFFNKIAGSWNSDSADQESKVQINVNYSVELTCYWLWTRKDPAWSFSFLSLSVG